MKFTRANTTLLAISALLASCSSFKTNQFSDLTEPSDGPKARVRAIIKYASLMATPDACAGVTKSSGMVIAPAIALASSGYKGKKIGMPNKMREDRLSSSEAAEFYVVGDHPITFFTADNGGGYHCNLSPVTFTPETDKDYEIEYFHDFKKKTCGVTLWSFTDQMTIPLLRANDCKSAP